MEYRNAHKKQISASIRKWQQENSEKWVKYVREWQKANPEKRLASERRYNSKHPDAVRRKRHNRRARIRGNGGTYTLKELNDLFEKQEGFCFYCGELLYVSFDREVHVDHMIPLSRGGSNSIENIVLSCATCNLEKNTKTSDEYLKLKKETQTDVQTQF
jgi:5-methylcytosine-specific restriction endonuclease McrA